MRLWLCALALTTAAAPALALPVTAQHIKQHTPRYTLDVSYPRTGMKAIDDEISAWIKSQVDDLVAASKNAPPNATPYSPPTSVPFCQVSTECA